MFNSRRISASFVGLALFAFSTAAHASLIEVVIDGNDCSGFFGSGFDNCNIFGESPSIAKFDEADVVAGGGTPTDINALFPSITGSEWSFTGAGTSGTWTYNPNDPEDPFIKFWAVKAGPSFNFAYFVPNANQAFCSLNPLALSCIQSATVIPTNQAIDWKTGVAQSISHITFYDTSRSQAPVPGTLSLLALGGLALAARRKRTP